MNPYNFVISNCDTDSISFCKPDGAEFHDKAELLKELNDISPDLMVWEDDGYYKTMIIVRAKNYVMELPDGTIKYKGNSIKAPMKEEALREFIKAIINELLYETYQFETLYAKYVEEIMNITDITRWCSKKTITPAVLNPKRSNEQKILDSIKDTEYTEGDKIHVFYLEDESLCLKENFTGEYNKKRLLEKLYNTGALFDTILETEQIFKNYTLKRNKKELEELYGEC